MKAFAGAAPTKEDHIRLLRPRRTFCSAKKTTKPRRHEKEHLHVSETTNGGNSMQTTTEFRDLLIAALPHLRAYARSLTGSADQADDLVQDTALRLLSAQDQYRQGTNFRAWAIAALRNRFIDLRRR